MKPSLHFLTNHLFDYAGLFPPAQLPLEPALKNYFLYLNHPDSDALGKFILPASKCRECVDILRSKPDEFVSSQNLNFGTTALISFSILLSQAPSADKIDDSLRKDFSDVAFFIQNVPSSMQISSYEISLPVEFYALDSIKILNVFEHLNSFAEGTVFCEMPFLPEALMTHFLSLVTQHNALQHSKKICIKLRTGGVKKEHVPSVKNLSRAIFNLGQFRIPFKVTAGLHVPVPNFNSSVGTKMHGFLNVLFASMCVFFKEQYSDFDLSNVEHILENLDYENLDIQENAMRLNMTPKYGQQIKTAFQTPIAFSNEMIQKFKEQFFKGIGSCEFVEPLEHLKIHYPKAWES